jgi:hypothetical protein
MIGFMEGDKPTLQNGRPRRRMAERRQTEQSGRQRSRRGGFVVATRGAGGKERGDSEILYEAIRSSPLKYIH